MPVRVTPLCSLIVAAAIAGGCGGGGGADGADDSRRGIVAQASAASTGTSGGGDGGGSAARPGGLVVDVAGMVRAPGVYELPRGSRVHEAIAAAGGVRTGGVLTSLNRAAEVVDGQQIVVPHGREGTSVATGSEAASSGSSSGAGAGAKVSLNTADVAALDALPGIGPVTAQRIVDDRTANGPFAGVEDLDRVSGIGAATVADLEALVTP